ncbi:MAG: type II toxin-antitoxin system PemK/MazF family toxin [Synechococcaceae cyanobacterium]|jgi:mRNA interferase MazF
MIRRGEVWVARLHPNQGAEVGKVRPVVVVPLTTQRRRGAEALRVCLHPRDRLLQECWAMAEHPRALDRNRLGEGPLTRLSAEEMDTLNQALRAALGLSGR